MFVLGLLIIIAGGITLVEIVTSNAANIMQQIYFALEMQAGISMIGIGLIVICLSNINDAIRHPKPERNWQSSRR